MKIYHLSLMSGIAAIVTCLLASCAVHPTSTPTSGKKRDFYPPGDIKLPANFYHGNKVENSPSSEPEYIRSEAQSELGQLVDYKLSESAFQKKKRDRAGERLTPLSLAQAFKVQAYSIDHYAQEGAVLLTPKIMFQSSLSGQKSKVVDLPDGRVSLLGAIALVDGLQSEIWSVSGKKKIPSDYLISKPDEFLAALQSELGVASQLVSSLECPSHIVVSAPGQGDIEVELTTQTQMCQINEFFPAQLSVKKEDARKIKETFLRGNSLTLKAELNLSQRIVTEYAFLKLYPRWILNVMNAFFKSNRNCSA